MASLDSLVTTCRPWALSLLQIVIGLLFLERGTSKYLSLPVSQMMGAARARRRLAASTA